MNVNSRQLNAFVQVAQLRNFTRAAERVYMTQAGLSAMMRELEGQMGARLFDRTTRFVVLTEAGENFFPVAMRILKDLHDVGLMIGHGGEHGRRPLRVAATPMVAAALLPTVCKAYSDEGAPAGITVVDCDLGQVRQLVEQGDADVGIGFFSKAIPGLRRTLLTTARLMLVERRDTRNVQAFPAVGTWGSLDGRMLFGLPANNPIQHLVDAQLAKLAGEARVGRTFNHFATLIAMVGAGEGVAILPSLAASMCIGHPVGFRCLEDPVVEVGLYQIAKMGTQQHPLLATFGQRMAASLSQIMSTIDPAE